MKITEVDAKQEMQVLASLVYNDKVLAAVSPRIEREAFQSRYGFKIAEKCRRYFEKYHKAPRTHIHDYLSSQIENSENREETESLQRILDNLTGLKVSVNGKKSNDKYLIDRAEHYLMNTRFGSLLVQAKTAYDSGELEKASTVVTKLNRASLTVGNHTYNACGLKSSEIGGVFAEPDKPLIRYSGALGKFFDQQLARDNFIAFQGPEKSFKSFWLQEIVIKALKERLRVMFIGIGDMSQRQYSQRFYSRIVGRPFRRGEYFVPIGWKTEKGTHGTHVPRRRRVKEISRMTTDQVNSKLKRFYNKYLGTDRIEDYLKSAIVGEISLQTIESDIFRFQDVESWTPDVLVIDYADRLNPPKGVQDKIQQVDYNWNKLRAMALEHHCLVITATQVKRSGYKGFLQKRDDVADSKGKTAVVTGLIGISAFPEEMQTDTRRLGWIVCREHTPRQTVSVAACPAIGNPCVIST